MTERELEKILQEEPDDFKVHAAVRQYRMQHRKTEDKQTICSALCLSLQLTRDQKDLKDLIWHETPAGDEFVEICYSDGGHNVDVTADSGIAMIRDILRAIS